MLLPADYSDADLPFALYYMLSASVELRHAPFILWIHDLSAQDPYYYILPIIMGRDHVFCHPEDVADHRDRPDAAEDHDLYAGHLHGVLPVVPSGLVVYCIVRYLVTIIQQQLIYRGSGETWPA
ncbi:hypothetical protein LN650_01595 [Klebsiella pneumoniae subsp. pneumoniae]|nr:hypothetical protein [Klebsiella pneumoniae subsp. pneumoniae]